MTRYEICRIFPVDDHDTLRLDAVTTSERLKRSCSVLPRKVSLSDTTKSCSDTIAAGVDANAPVAPTAANCVSVTPVTLCGSKLTVPELLPGFGANSPRITRTRMQRSPHWLWPHIARCPQSG